MTVESMTVDTEADNTDNEWSERYMSNDLPYTDEIDVTA